jgi:hypothetical protein
MAGAQMAPDALMLERLVRSLLSAAAASAASSGPVASSDGVDAGAGARGASDASAGASANGAGAGAADASDCLTAAASSGSATESSVIGNNDADADDETAMRRGRFWLMAVQIYARVRDNARIRLSNDLHRLMVRPRSFRFQWVWVFNSTLFVFASVSVGVIMSVFVYFI